MPGEAREPRLDTGMDLLKLLERETTDPPKNTAEAELRLDMQLDFLDRLLDEARAEERATIAFQLGLVAGEGYKQLRELQEWIEALLRTWSENTKGGLYDELHDILTASMKPTAPITEAEAS